jgi:hypothetical protein
MIDVSGPKVLVPSVLFALLSPELILAFPPNYGFLEQVLFHALIMSILTWFIIKFIFRYTVTVADIIVPATVFILMTPGVILTLPPIGGKFLFSGETGITQIMVHTMIFAVLYASVRGVFPSFF